MTYKQAQSIYGIQGRSIVLTWLRKHGKMDWTQSPKMSDNVIYCLVKSLISWMLSTELAVEKSI